MTIMGTAANDHLTGGASSDYIVGRAGKDYIHDGGGNVADRIEGGRGDDKIVLRGGADEIVFTFREEGDDRVRGFGDDDTLRFDQNQRAMITDISEADRGLMVTWECGGVVNTVNLLTTDADDLSGASFRGNVTVTADAWDDLAALSAAAELDAMAF